ncbi:alpha/beta hydrolase [Actinomadura rugatobispora]|uniref:Alpha/beta hydrolase n=1 Tax=Actinomadura rugatobispora TaxID=1994 RepID=A0ABW0ZZ82_9ACTN|nr:alpha/beta hydrolase [Actinomadura rugatobispora]
MDLNERDIDDWPGHGLTDAELDAAYNVRALAGEERFGHLMARYRAMSDAAVEGLPGHPGIVYDETGGERLDVWGPGRDGEARPVFVFLHGGYWRALSRADSAFMARTLHRNGVATVVPDYTLAPAATLEEIVRQVRAAVAWVHRHGRAHGLDPGRVVVGGSSAGGHLTAMTMLDGWQAEFGLPGDAVRAAMPFSGLFDLRPLTRVYVNEWLGLDVRRAAALSPELLPAGRSLPAVVAVAEHDGPGFLQQSRRFARHWGRAAELMVVPDRDHFDVVLDLADERSAVSRALLALVHSL